MQVLPAVIAAIICGICIYVGSIFVNSRVRPINMRKMKMQAVALPILVFVVLLVFFNL